MITWKKWLIQATIRLLISQSISVKCDSEILLGHVVGASKSELLAFDDNLLTQEQCIVLEKLLQRREKGEPIAHLTGKSEFWSLQLRVSIDTLIPRPDTECLVQCAIDLLPSQYAKLLDLGTGSGAIALAIASERSGWNITGIDRLPGAVLLARDNAICLGLDNVCFYQKDWYKPFKKELYNIIVSNPPYIAEGDPHLIKGDLRFEQRSILVSGKNGLQDLMAICLKAKSHLVTGGWLVLEHGWNQGAAVRMMLASAGFSNINTKHDYGNNERVSNGQLL